MHQHTIYQSLRDTYQQPLFFQQLCPHRYQQELYSYHESDTHPVMGSELAYLCAPYQSRDEGLLVCLTDHKYISNYSTVHYQDLSFYHVHLKHHDPASIFEQQLIHEISRGTLYHDFREFSGAPCALLPPQLAHAPPKPTLLLSHILKFVRDYKISVQNTHQDFEQNVLDSIPILELHAQSVRETP